MYYLILDTSKNLSLGIFNGNTMVDSIVVSNFTIKNALSDILLPTIQELLIKNNLTLTHVSFIGFVVGVGYFTSLRVGFSVVKTLKVALNIPIIPCNNLYVMAYNYLLNDSEGNHLILSTGDIGKVGAVIALFNVSMEYLIEPIYVEDDVEIVLSAYLTSSNIVVVGNKIDYLSTIINKININFTNLVGYSLQNIANICYNDYCNGLLNKELKLLYGNNPNFKKYN